LTSIPLACHDVRVRPKIYAWARDTRSAPNAQQQGDQVGVQGKLRRQPPLRCCADDVAPTYKSQASCKQLGWNWNDLLGDPAVCGASQCRGTLGVQSGGGAVEYGEVAQAHAEMVSCAHRWSTRSHIYLKFI